MTKGRGTVKPNVRTGYERLEAAAARWREAYYANTKAHQGTTDQNAALSDLLDALLYLERKP